MCITLQFQGVKLNVIHIIYITYFISRIILQIIFGELYILINVFLTKVFVYVHKFQIATFQGTFEVTFKYCFSWSNLI